MHIAHFNIKALKISGQILCHCLGKRCYKHPFFSFGADMDFGNQIVHLILGRLNGDNRIKQPCGADNLLHNLRGTAFFKIARRCRGENHLIDFFIKFIKLKRPVIKGRRQPETVFNKACLSAVIAAVHSPYLRKHNMAFIAEQQKIIRKIIQQCKRRIARLLNTLTEACFLKHFNIIHCALLDSLRLKKLSVCFKISNTLNHFIIDFFKCRLHFFLPHNIMRCRINADMGKYALHFSRKRIDFTYTVYLITEKLHTDCVSA